jgi:hypothetical protein
VRLRPSINPLAESGSAPLIDAEGDRRDRGQALLRQYRNDRRDILCGRFG